MLIWTGNVGYGAKMMLLKHVYPNYRKMIKFNLEI